MRTQIQIVDLSWPVRPGMPMYPGDPPVSLTPMGRLETDGYASHLASLPAHSGTHIDAPAHVLEGAAALADLPLSRFAGAGVVLDLRGRHAQAVTTADILPHLVWLREQQPSFALLLTGDGARFGEPEYYSQGAHLTPEAALLLAGQGLSGIGLDAGSADPLEATGLPAHRALLSAGVVIVENLRGLEQLPPAGFVFVCLPVLGTDGSPVRAAAILPCGISGGISVDLTEATAGARQ